MLAEVCDETNLPRMDANEVDLLADGVDDELRLVEFDVVAAPRGESLL